MKSHLLVYRSATRADVTSADMDSMIAAAQIKNGRIGVSGFLLWRAPQVVQVIEGAAPEVHILFNRIAADPRHRDVSKFYAEDLPESRSFAWSMRFWNRGRPSPVPADLSAAAAVLPAEVRIIMSTALGLRN